MRLLRTVLGKRSGHYVEDLSMDTYYAFVARAKQPTKRCKNGFSRRTIHCYAQVTRRFGKWLEDTDRLPKSPFRQVPLDPGGNDGKRRRALTCAEGTSPLQLPIAVCDVRGVASRSDGELPRRGIAP